MYPICVLNKLKTETFQIDKIPVSWKSGDKPTSQLRLSHEQNIGDAYSNLGKLLLTLRLKI